MTGNVWRRERRLFEGRFVHLVVRGYGSAARYITNDQGVPKHFTLDEARKHMNRRNAAARRNASIDKRIAPLVTLAHRVAMLNPDAGEIGPGMLASLVEDARQALASAGVDA